MGTVDGHSLHAIALSVLLLGAALALPAGAAGGTGGQPVGETTLHAGDGGSDGQGGSGGLNDTSVNAHGGDGGASTEAGPSAGSAADIGSFGGATPGAGGAAGAATTEVSPGVWQGDAGGAGQSQTGDLGGGNGYGGGGGGGQIGNAMSPATTAATFSATGGAGGAGGNGYWAAGGGGAGGHGATLLDPLADATASGVFTGGAGGAGGDAFSQAGGGGSGGSGLWLRSATPGRTLTHSGTSAGGAGGAGGAELLPARSNAAGGGGGAGGAGLTLAGSTALTVVNTGQLLGGAGGAGGAGGGGVGGTGTPGNGGDGGAGLASAGAGGAIVVNSGTIAGGAGGAGGASSNGGPAGLPGAGGAGVRGADLDLQNSGTLAGGLGGDGVTRAPAVAFTGGSSNRLVLNAGGTLLGAVAIDSGASARLVAGTNGLDLGNALLLGGTGTIDSNGHGLGWSGPISGAGELVKVGAGTLTLSGANTYTGATRVAAGSLRAGAANTFSSASAFTVDAGAVLDLAGHSQTIAGMASAGTVSLLSGSPGATLTVQGPWVGNGGTLRLGTALGGSGSLSDRLILSGCTAIASGTTNIQVTNLGGLGALTVGSGIEVVTAMNGATTTAQTTRDAFRLAGGHVDAGAYEYRLHAGDASGAGENWYLRSTTTVVPPGDGGKTPTDGGGGAAAPGDEGLAAPGPVLGLVVPTYRAEAALYAALPSQLRQGNLAMIGDLHKRIGDDDAKGTAATSTNPAGSERRAWARVLSTDIDIRQGGTVSPSSKGRLTGFQAGTDLMAATNWRAGLYVGQLDGDARVNGFASGLQNQHVGRNDLRSQYFGIYGTYTGNGGFYADAVVQSGRHRYTVEPVLGAGVEGKGRSLLGSIEVGQAFALGASGWSVEPQLQLVHQHMDLDNSVIPGAIVQPEADSGWIVRAGVRVKGTVATGVGTLQPYGRFNVYRSSSGADIARFVNGASRTDIASSTGGTSTELAGGFTLALGDRTSVYGEVGKLWASGGDTRVKSSINASVGVRVKW
ncbi:autotransporter outer membrane beta-barrel domain-containing protein [Variovorax sp. CCNWLW235]